MSDQEKNISKVFGIIIIVAIIACLAGGIIWFFSSGLLQSHSLMLGNSNDEAPSHVTETMTELDMGEASDNTSTLVSVMCENSSLYDCKAGKTVTIADIAAEGEIESYTLVDLNADGEKDLVLKLKKGDANVSYVLIRNEHGVWGLEFSEAEMSIIYATGYYQGSSNGATTYFMLQTSDEKIVNKQIGDDTGTDFQALKDGDESMSAVSRVEFIEYINAKCGTLIQDYKTYSQDELKKDLENPDAYDFTKELVYGPEYWSALICELPQYNDELGKSYAQFIKGDEEYYTEDAKWMHDAEEIYCCTNLENAKAIGTDDSIYDAECVLIGDDQVVMTGALMNNAEAYVSDFMVDGSFDIEPAVFSIPGKTGNDMGTDALVWSCDDSYLVIFSTPDSRDDDFYNRPAWAVCYVKKEYCGVTRYPIAVLPTMSAELE